MLEFMTFISLVFSLRYSNKVVGFVISLFYFVWLMLYRFATNVVHRQLWNTFSFHVVRLAGTLPGFVGNIAMAGLACANAVGTIACKFYSPRKTNSDTLDM
jgi:hypothetical protein